MKKHKKLYIFLFSFMGLFAIFIIGLAINTSFYKTKLLTDGIRVEAQVLKLEEQRTRKGKTKRCYVDLAIFTEGKLKEVEIKDDNQSAMDKKIDAIFANTSLNRQAGEFFTVRKSIAQHNYGALNTGDWVTFVYLEGEIEDGIMLMSLE